MCVLDKTQFSMMTPEAWAFFNAPAAAAAGGAGAASAAPLAPAAVLFGIEAHVCVQQTALDLLAAGVPVVLPVDGVSSQRPGDREMALRLLERSGAVLTTTESLLFSIAGDAAAPSFKPLAKLVKEHNARHRTTLDRVAFPADAPRLA